eukprot:12214073-Heterocapsa_arctica.AAC.1
MNDEISNIGGSNVRIGASIFQPIGFKDATVQQLEFRPHLMHTQALAGQDSTRIARSSNDRLR